MKSSGYQTIWCDFIKIVWDIFLNSWIICFCLHVCLDCEATVHPIWTMCIPFFSAFNARHPGVELVTISLFVHMCEIFKCAPVKNAPIIFDLVFADRKAQVPERTGTILSKSEVPFFRIQAFNFLVAWTGRLSR